MSRTLRIALITLGLAGLLGGTTAAASPSCTPLLVRTDAVPVNGVAEDGLRTFAGIPYAAPPAVEPP